MKNTILLTLILAFATLTLQAQDVTGLWKTIDDETGQESSILEIYEADGKIYGKVIEILEVDKKGSLCDLCLGKDKDQPVKGMIIIKGLKKNGSVYKGGKILDPNNGKLYKCSITLDGADKLKVRGYIGFSALGRTQYWYRIIP